MNHFCRNRYLVESMHLYVKNDSYSNRIETKEKNISTYQILCIHHYYHLYLWFNIWKSILYHFVMCIMYIVHSKNCIKKTHKRTHARITGTAQRTTFAKRWMKINRIISCFYCWQYILPLKERTHIRIEVLFLSLYRIYYIVAFAKGSLSGNG